ncbi:class F sortase [Streptomyces sp. SID13588]|uniref:class F sortase n=1 Tax=Streptomyces sp. SID13588 TaxID=2706051 RepID=UPI0013CAD6FD|nr:class F sortase [Streptomyces sp. SID13588]NEA73834.1 class F sortase [Streptomyces sp. SID13588]
MTQRTGPGTSPEPDSEAAAPRPAGGGTRRHTILGVTAALVLAGAGGAVALTGASSGSGPPPQPPAAAAQAITAHPTSPQPPSSPAPPRASSHILPASAPVSLDIPAIGVRTTLLSLGRSTDGTVQVPWQPLKAGWYKDSPTPGQLGASVILGHVDSKETGPAVFYQLGALKPGARITVTRTDGTTATFTTDIVRAYPKDHFPTLDVYTTTADRPQLRLITCGNWDPATHTYLGNIVAYATLTDTAG